MTFEQWKEKFVYSSRLHIDEDTAVDMYNAAYDFGYDEGEDQSKSLRLRVKKLKETAEWSDMGDYPGILDEIEAL